MTELNNLAQSNYDKFISATSIPSREITTVAVGNPYSVETRVFLHSGQTNPLYRTYLEWTSLWLKPGESRHVTVMFEYAPDNLTNHVYPQSELPKVREMQRVPNNVGIVARIEDPNDTPRHKIDVLGGAQAQIVTGKSTRFERFGAGEGSARGTVMTVEGKKPAPGKVIVRVTMQSRGGESGRENVYEYRATTLKSGSFQVKIPSEGLAVAAYYVPTAGYADCWSGTVRLKRSPPGRKKHRVVRRRSAKRRGAAMSASRATRP